MNEQVRNPYLPEAPADGQHKFGDGPADLGGNRRCTLCGAYRGSDEGNAPCRGEWSESGKMRLHAANLWLKDLALEGGPARQAFMRVEEQPLVKHQTQADDGRTMESGAGARHFLILECGHRYDLDRWLGPFDFPDILSAVNYSGLRTFGCAECHEGRNFGRVVNNP